MIHSPRIRAASMLVLTLLSAGPAAAHHPMGGITPATLMEGLLSGIGHPIIGPDHFAFLIAIGVLTSVASLRLFMPLIFVAGSAVGVGVHLLGVNVPGAELVIAASVVLIGAVLAFGRAVPPTATILLLSLAGLFHGYAYGEAVIGAESGPVWAYLAGLAIIQSVVALVVVLAVQRLKGGSATWVPRVTGMAVAATGAAIVLSQFRG
jgi:urease accessory protein